MKGLIVILAVGVFLIGTTAAASIKTLAEYKREQVIIYYAEGQ